MVNAHGADLQKAHLISHVAPGSIAEELGIKPGDRVMSLDNRIIEDAFDFYLWQLSEDLVLTVLTDGSELIEFEIEKDADEPLGLTFAQSLLDECRTCHNHCVFCFIDQLPEGMRQTMYLKDDDLRMSFLNGNYVTLTNISDTELDRLISHRLSPMNISVHTTDAALRIKMMGNRKAGAILGRLQRIAAAGLSINAQIVLCPGLNDGLALEKTMSDLYELGPSLNSVAVVPVGLTRYREQNHLVSLQPVSQQAAVLTIDKINHWQEKSLKERGNRLVFAADELYLLAKRPLPSFSEYDNFPQLENGVGMAVRTLSTIRESITSASRQLRGGNSAGQPDLAGKTYILVSGIDFASLLQPLQLEISELLGCHIHVKAVENTFFGPLITVTGLLTGQDILVQLAAEIRQIQQIRMGSCEVIVPDNLFRAGTSVLLDDISLQDLTERLQIPVHACAADGSDLLDILLDLNRQEGVHADE